MKLSMLALGAALTMQVASHAAVAQDQATDPAEMMKQYHELSTPGYEHQLLEPFVGKWDVKATMWMEPGSEPIESVAKAKTEWIMDGHYQRMSYEGEAMGMPFTGESISGYNKVTGKFFGTWIDSMSTAMSVSYGDVDATGTTFTYHAEYDDPMTGGKRKSKEVIKVKNKDAFTMTAYMIMDDGSEFEHMKLEYKRTK